MAKKTKKAPAKTQKAPAKPKKGSAKPTKVAKKATPKAAKKMTVPKKAKAPVKAGSKLVKKVVKTDVEKTATQTNLKSLKAASRFNLQPLDNRIVIEVEQGPSMTPGGLYIPDSAQMTGNQKGRVIAVGSGHISKKGKKRPLELKVGDQVLFAEWAGDKLEWNGQPVRILRESDVLGLVD